MESRSIFVERVSESVTRSIILKAQIAKETQIALALTELRCTESKQALPVLTGIETWQINASDVFAWLKV